MSSGRKWFNSERRLPLLIGIVVILAAVVVVVNFDIPLPWGENAGTLSGKSAQLEEALRRLRNLQRTLETPDRDFLKREDVLVSETGESRLILWQQVQEKAAQHGVSMKTLGRMQDTKITDGVMGYELMVDAEASVGNICNFLIELSQSKPHFMWDSLSLKPSGGNVLLSGTLKVVVVTSPAVVKRLWGDDGA